MVKEGDIIDWSLLPAEIWIRHILCLLPVKTLLVMRAVNKSFLAMVDDESLSAIHLHGGEEARLVFLLVDYKKPRHELLDSTSYQAYCAIGQRNCVEVMCTASFATKMRFPYPRTGSIVEGFLNGLVLLRVQWMAKGYLEGAALWNPSIRKIRQLPILPSVSGFRGRLNVSPRTARGFSRIRLGLGYDPSTKDYKVLAMFNLMDRAHDDDDLQGWGVWVYSILKTRAWTPVFNSGLSMWPRRARDWNMCQPVPYKGFLLWIETALGFPGYRPMIDPDDSLHRVARFDLATHRFCYCDMPSLTLQGSDWEDLTIAMIECGGRSCLALADSVDATGAVVGIWTMDNVDNIDTMSMSSWSRRYISHEMYLKYWTRCSHEDYYVFDDTECPTITRRTETVGPYVESLLLLNERAA